MIIWGWSTRSIGTVPTKAKCSHCQHEGLVLEHFQTFFKLFFVPTLALKKSSFLFCEVCGVQYPAELLNSSSRAIASKTAAKTPWWGFLGVYIVLGFMGIGFWANYTDDQRKSRYLADLHVNDILILKDKTEKKIPYYFLKITDVANEKVSFIVSTHNYSHLSDARDKAQKASSSDFVDGYYEGAIAELKNNEIEAIYRDEKNK